MKKGIMPIVFSANDSYTLYTKTAIASLKRFRNDKYIYQIYIMHSGMNEVNQNKLKELAEDGFEIDTVDISEVIQSIELKESLHLSIETYYRLFIPFYFKRFSKVIYLDSDLVLCDDISKLYEIEVGDNVIGAVQDVQSYYLQEHYINIGIDDNSATFNAGVLLINIEQFVKQRICEKCISLLQEDYKKIERKMIYADQDALNSVLREKVYWIDKKWNYQFEYLWRIDDLIDGYKDEYLKNRSQAKIVHYAGGRKPWKDISLPMSNLFWNNARLVGTDLEIIAELSKEIEKKEKVLNSLQEYRFPFEYIMPNTRVALYGAGVVGNCFYNLLRLTKYAQVTLWVDKKISLSDDKGNVLSIDELVYRESEYDKIVVAIANQSIAREVIYELDKMGISKDCVVWTEYFG